MRIDDITKVQPPGFIEPRHLVRIGWWVRVLAVVHGLVSAGSGWRIIITDRPPSDDFPYAGVGLGVLLVGVASAVVIYAIGTVIQFVGERVQNEPSPAILHDPQQPEQGDATT